jgi:pyrroline-5-carboxylate reductase
MQPPTADSRNDHIAFIGGGNMASAIIGGLLKRGLFSAGQIQVIEPSAEQRARLAQQFQVAVSETPGASLGRAALVVWAVKPQTFRQAAEQSRAHTQNALHLSVAAGIRSGSIAGWLNTERVVRAMPNTPALIGQGMTALFARPAASAADRLAVERIVQTMGEHLWLEQEAQLDAVTALSGSGPAYVFYFIEAMIQAGIDMGLSREQSRRLAIGTFAGASALAQDATEAPEVLRERVTSKGGTTYAALTSMEHDGIKAQFMRAMHAARQRAAEMGDEFGAG